jgi:phage terminase large subunit-like protein
MKPKNTEGIRLRELADTIDELKDSETNFVAMGKLLRNEIDSATKKDDSDYLKGLEMALQKAKYYYHHKDNKKRNFDNFVKEFKNCIKTQRYSL